MGECRFDAVSADDLKIWLDGGEPLILIDVLPGEFFEARRIAGAKNACVYEVTFQDQVSGITIDKGQKIVVYGSSEASMDSHAAAEKLTRMGFGSVYKLTGGIAAWQAAGYPIEGQDVPSPSPSNALTIKDGQYPVDTAASTMEWFGRNAGKSHFGAVGLKRGEIKVENGEVTGEFVIDMKTITNIDLAGDEYHKVLLDHLASDDFFFTTLFPSADFIIESAKMKDDPQFTSPNYDVSGFLTLRGVTAALKFPATINFTDEGKLSAEAHFDIDRTKWNVIYGSTRFFQHLSYHVVFDLISVGLRIVTA